MQEQWIGHFMVRNTFRRPPSLNRREEDAWVQCENETPERTLGGGAGMLSAINSHGAESSLFSAPINRRVGSG